MLSPSKLGRSASLPPLFGQFTFGIYFIELERVLLIYFMHSSRAPTLSPLSTATSDQSICLAVTNSRRWSEKKATNFALTTTTIGHWLASPRGSLVQWNWARPRPLEGAPQVKLCLGPTRARPSSRGLPQCHLNSSPAGLTGPVNPVTRQHPSLSANGQTGRLAGFNCIGID